MARDQLNAARDLIVRQDRRIKELGGVSVLPLEMQQWPATIGDPEPDPDPDPNPDEPTTAPAPVIDLSSIQLYATNQRRHRKRARNPILIPVRSEPITRSAGRGPRRGRRDWGEIGDKPAKKRGRPPSAKTVAKNARVAARTAKLKAAMG